MPYRLGKKVKSPTGRPSKVRPEMKDFDKGKKVAGKRPPKPVVKPKRKRKATRAELMDAGRPLLQPRKKKKKKTSRK